MYHDVSNAKAVLMANLFNYGSDVISEGLEVGLIQRIQGIGYGVLEFLGWDCQLGTSGKYGRKGRGYCRLKRGKKTMYWVWVVWAEGLDEFANKIVAKNTKSSEEESKAVMKNVDAPIIDVYLLDNEEEIVTQPKIVKKTVKPSIHMTEFVKPRQQEKIARKTIKNTQSKETPKEASSPRTTLGGGPRDKNSMKLNELMELCTNLQLRVLALEKTKTTQALEITSLESWVKKLKKKQTSRTYKLKRLYKVGLTAKVDSSEDEPNLGEDASKQGRKVDDIDADKDITLFNDQDDADDAEIFDVNDLDGEEVFVDKDDVDKEVNDEVQKVVEDINTTKLIVDGAQVNAASIATTDSAAATITIDEVTLVKELPKKKEQIRHDEEATLKLQAELQVEFKEEQRLAREKAQKELEANNALIETWDDKRRKFFVVKRAEEKRNKSPTQAQQRKIMCTYLKNMKGKKLKHLKNKSFDSIQKMFDKALSMVNTFVDFRTELLEGSSKRAREELTQERSKKQKVDDDKETTKLKKLIEIILKEEEVAIDAIPLTVKSPKIVD
uniref:Uncharacterized protein n=1 Tax=Tanacetum cinerariifolium TaxID=118510 RepID=A0A6L2NVR9_TANCI|nr:hypothetical protein [Tanacetum cinerariifolium]